MSDEAKSSFTTSREAHAAFADRVAALEATQAAQPAPQPEATALAAVATAQGAKGADGKRLYSEDSAYRARVFEAQKAAFAGKSAAEVQAILNGTPAQGTPATPEGSQSKVADYLDKGGTIGQADVPAATWSALTAGYVVNLPDGYVLSGEHVEMLQTARRAGMTQDAIDAFIAEALKGGES